MSRQTPATPKPEEHYRVASVLEVLAVDLDRQGNLQKDLGYREDDRHDQGEMLFRALTDDDRHLEPVLTEVRPNLDVIPGGEQIEYADAGLARMKRARTNISKRSAGRTDPYARIAATPTSVISSSHAAGTLGGAMDTVRYAQTVLGRVPTDQLGPVMAHDHMLVFQPGIDDYEHSGQGVTNQEMWEAPITLENVGWIRLNWLSNKANLSLDEYDVALAELRSTRTPVVGQLPIPPWQASAATRRRLRGSPRKQAYTSSWVADSMLPRRTPSNCPGCRSTKSLPSSFEISRKASTARTSWQVL